MSEPGRFARFRAAVSLAFSMEEAPLAAGDRDLIDRLARAIARRRLAAPASFALESHAPLRRLAGQGMRLVSPAAAALKPFLADLLARENLSPDDYDRLADILECKEGWETLLAAIAKAEEETRDD